MSSIFEKGLAHLTVGGQRHDDKFEICCGAERVDVPRFRVRQSDRRRMMAQRSCMVGRLDCGGG